MKNRSPWVTLWAASSALFAIHCASSVEPAPGPLDQDTENTGETREALCGNGLHPGCGICYPDSASPSGGIQTCWACNGVSYERDCAVTCGEVQQPCCDAPQPCFYSGSSCVDGICSGRVIFRSTPP